MSFNREQKLGGVFAASAYTFWGIVPIYFKQIDFIPAAEILVHRIVWSFLLLLLVLFILKQQKKIVQILSQPKLVLGLFIAALLLAGNWWIFIWAVNNDHILDTSLGYYINPLLNVFLGMVFLGEKLRRLQWFAVSLAVLGVLIQVLLYGAFPWVALALAMSFAFYGLLRKKLAVDALSGLFVESLLLLPLALWYWWQLTDSSTANLFHNTWSLNTLLILSGAVTTLPLLCFIGGAKRLALSTMGFFQYIGPSLSFMLGVMLYQEPLPAVRLVTFGFIWLALLIYSYDALRYNNVRISR